LGEKSHLKRGKKKNPCASAPHRMTCEREKKTVAHEAQESLPSRKRGGGKKIKIVRKREEPLPQRVTKKMTKVRTTIGGQSNLLRKHFRENKAGDEKVQAAIKNIKSNIGTKNECV